MLPRAPLGPKPSEFAGSLVSDEMMDVRPGLAPGNVDLQTTGSTTSPCARIEMVPSAGSAPAPLRSQRRMLLLHYEGCVEMDPPVGFAPTSSDLRDRCLAMSATEEFENGAACRCRPDAPCLEDRHACCYINTAMKWPLEWVARPPLRIFNPPLICLSHPACFKKWSLGVVTLHGLPVIDRLLCC